MTQRRHRQHLPRDPRLWPNQVDRGSRKAAELLGGNGHTSRCLLKPKATCERILLQAEDDAHAILFQPVDILREWAPCKPLYS